MFPSLKGPEMRIFMYDGVKNVEKERGNGNRNRKYHLYCIAVL